MKRTFVFIGRSAALLSVFTLFSQALAQDADIFTTYKSSSLISFQPNDNFGGFILRVSGPGDFNYTREFSSKEAPFIEIFNLEGAMMGDGQYAFEVSALPVLDPSVTDALTRARETGEDDIIQSM